MTEAQESNSYHLSYPSRWQSYFNRNKGNLESHQLLWVDYRLDDIDTDEEELFSTVTQFHQLVNHTTVFDHWRTCLDYIEKKSSDTFTFLVCSIACAKDIVLKLWLSKRITVWKVYVYDSENLQNQLEWLQDYNGRKLCSIHTKLESLLLTIEKDVQEYLRHNKAGIFSELRWTPENTVDDNYRSWWRNLINVLVSLPYPGNYHYQLVHEFKSHGFDGEIFEEFQNDFPSSKRAIWWYSRSSYFFAILNRAFRQRNIRILLLFGSFLQDLYRELKSEYLDQKQQRENSTKTVYRGQVMSRKDFEKLAVGSSVRCNSLFSSSDDLETALAFLASSLPDEEIQRVLFEIELDYQTVCIPFADISQLSLYGDERETLFMANTRFLVEGCHQIEVNGIDGSLLQYWLVKLKLLLDFDLYSARQLEIIDAAKRTVKNCVDSLSEMLEMVSIEDIHLVFDTIANLYPEEKNWISAIRLYSLGMFEFENNDNSYEMMVKYHEDAIAIWQKYYLDDDELNCYFNIAESHFALGELFEYSVESKKNLAMHHWKHALSFYELALPRCTSIATDYARVSILNKLIRVCEKLLSGDFKQYGCMTINYQKAWMELLLAQEPTVLTSRQIGVQFRKLADIYANIRCYADAISNYEEAVNLYLSKDRNETEHSSLVIDLIDLYENIITICTKHTHDFQLALKYRLLQHECKLENSKKNEVVSTFLYYAGARYRAESHFDVADCYINTKQYVPAYKHLTNGLQYLRDSRQLFLEDVTTLVGYNNHHLSVPSAEDDNRVKDCVFRIKEKEDKLKSLQPLLEKD